MRLASREVIATICCKILRRSVQDLFIFYRKSSPRIAESSFLIRLRLSAQSRLIDMSTLVNMLVVRIALVQVVRLG
jgi:hypothetical protein